MQAPLIAAADDCFARFDVAELTIELATEDTPPAPAPGDRNATIWIVRPSRAIAFSRSERPHGRRVRWQPPPPAA